MELATCLPLSTVSQPDAFLSLTTPHLTFIYLFPSLFLSSNKVEHRNFLEQLPIYFSTHIASFLPKWPTLADLHNLRDPPCDTASGLAAYDS
jgi:hypothetical protein